MTPEIKAALERVRKYHDAASGLVIYPAGVEASVATDLELLARAFVAEHADDDDEPVKLDWMESVVPEDGPVTIAMGDDVARVHLCEDDVANGIEIKTRRQLRALLEGLGVERG